MTRLEDKIKNTEDNIAAEEAKLQRMREAISDLTKSEEFFMTRKSAIKASVTFIKKLKRDLQKLKERL